MGEGVDKNLMENTDNRAAQTPEGEIGATSNAATIEPEGGRARASEENTELVTIDSSPKWGGGTLIEEEQPEEQENIPLTSAVNSDILGKQKKTSQRRRKRSIKEFNITLPVRKKRTKSAEATEAVKRRWTTLEAQVEFPILVPRPMDAPQKAVEEEPSIEGLLEENTLLKEEVQVLRRELETWKETCRKQGERKMYTLVEAAEQMEESNSTEPGKEDERVVCPACGEIFMEAGHKIILRTCTAQQSQATMEEPAEKKDVATQEPASLTTLAEAATNPVTEEKKDEIRNDDGDKDGTVNSECSHDIEMIEAEPQGQDTNELEQGVVTQEPATLNILVQLAEHGGE